MNKINLIIIIISITALRAVNAAGEEEAIELNKIVVSATRYEKSYFETPVSVSVIDKKDILEKSPQNAGELLKEVAGVEIHHDYTPGISKARIRGLSASRVVTLVDGKRWNSHISSLTGGDYLNSIDVGQIDRIEVIHGPASILYGSGAIGGVINIITRKSAAVKENYADVNFYSSYGSVNDFIAAGGEVECGYEKLNILVGAIKRSAGDLDTPEGKLEHSSFDSFNMNFNTRYAIGDKQSLSLSAQRFRGENIETPESKGEEFSLIIDIPRLNRDMVYLSYDVREIRSWFSFFNLSFHYQKEEVKYINSTRLGTLESGYSEILLEGVMEIDTFGAQTHGIFLYETIWPQTLTTGMEYYHDEAKSPLKMNGEDKVVVDGSYDSVAVFAHDEIKLHRDFIATIGGRYDWCYGQNETEDREKAENRAWALSAAAGLLYSITDHINFLASFSSAFRAPTLEELFYYGAVPGGGTLEGNPDLDPEISLNYEAGMKIRHSRIVCGISAYLNKINDYIIMAESDEPGVMTFSNIGEAEIWGIESSLDFIMSQSWSVFSTLGYTKGEDKTGDDPLEGIPPLKVILGLRYDKKKTPLFDGRFWSEISARIYDEQDRIPHDWTEDQKTPAFTVYDFRMGYNISSVSIIKDINFIFEIENLGNRKYKSFPVIYMKDLNWDDSLIQAGRNYKFSFHCKI
ncbi:MAG: TonB-dependent receptor [Spirochaetota bacterium]|nr:TonB-dependent receptor [Spirochaetota bacterium]